MTTLSLGVWDVPYAEGDEKPRYRVKFKKGFKPKVYKVASTTGDVAEILEAKYGIMAVFFEMYSYQIAGKLEEAMAAQIEALFIGAPISGDPFAEISGYVKEAFSRFLSQGEVEAVGIKGVPTDAAREGVSHRFKHPYARRESRPSFIDTGLYESSFIAEFKVE